MELNSSVNTFIGGMNLDSDISLLKENQYTYAENIRLLANEDSTTGVLQNRDCLKKWKESFLNNQNEQILGTVVTRIFDSTINASRECIVAITYYNNINIYNNIYIIYIDENKDEWVEIKHLIKDAQIGWSSKLKIVANYESDTVSKIYVCDGINHIKIIDLTKDYADQVFDKNSFDIAPISNMSLPTLLKITLGNLAAGTVLYAYQMFSKHGSESTISAVSLLINIPKLKATDSVNVFGGNKDELSNVGIVININAVKTTEFDMIRIYRIRYHKNNDIPEIFIITEFEIPENNNIIYSDLSDLFISKITVDEFNAITLTEFSPKVIEKHDNRLFAAGITEDTWDEPYDARAFRCDSNGRIKLRHSDATQTLEGLLDNNGNIDGKEVPKTHDCINPSNDILFGEDDQKYAYGIDDTGKTFVGGTGLNISYEFCFVDAVLSDDTPTQSESSSAVEYAPSINLTLNSSLGSTQYIDIKNSSGSSIEKHYLLTDGDKVLHNYSDSYFTANFLGYQRDEIYRFGIVFYNSKNQKSPVHWIGDIKMPSHKMAENNDSCWLPFHFADFFTPGQTPTFPKHVEMIGKVLGIRFIVKNIPDSVKKWLIVRCPRTETDRTIIAQGAISSLLEFDTWGDETTNLGDSDIRPMGLLNLGKNYFTRQEWNSNKPTYTKLIAADNYIEFVSPEICVSSSSILDNLKNAQLCELNWNYTYWPIQNTTDDETYREMPAWGTRPNQIYTNVLDKSPTENHMWAGMYINNGYESGTSAMTVYLDFGNGGYGYGGAALAKYYHSSLAGIDNVPHKIEDCVISNILPRIYEDEETKDYAQPIGSKNYINTSICGYGVMNNHGKCAVFKMSDDFTEIPSLDENGYLHYTQFRPYAGFDSTGLIADQMMNSTRICNIKQKAILYSGNTYSSRSNSTYIPCGKVHDSAENSSCVFGGDTYLNIFDYTHTTIRLKSNDPKTDVKASTFVDCYIPLESTVNTALFGSESYHKTIQNKKELSLNLIQYEPFVSAVYTLIKPLYEYNSAYSVDGNAQVFVPELLYSDPDSTYETRITCSELKTNNELVDSWTKFKFANYLDVDNQYGPVTNLKSFGGKLFFWQDSAVGVASVNERSLILDNNIAQLTLGTGGILVRYDYYTTLNGSWKVNDKSICNSASTLYWYDTDKHEICAINNTVIELSKVKGVKSWCNKLLGRTDTIGWYDWKYNEVLFQNKSEDIKRSMVFNEQLNVFTGFYTYPVEEVAQMVNNIITLDTFGNIYLHNSDINYEPFKSKIKYIINKGYPETKVFDNVWFDAELNGNVVSSIVFSTKTQETNPINFGDIENREDTYRFPIPRDKNGVARMRGKYLICDYTFDCKNDGDFKIPYVKTTFRISRV